MAWNEHFWAYLKFEVSRLKFFSNIPCIHWTEVISSHHTIFAPVQKVEIALTKFKSYGKVQGFVETLQIMSFENDL